MLQSEALRGGASCCAAEATDADSLFKLNQKVKQLTRPIALRSFCLEVNLISSCHTKSPREQIKHRPRPGT